MKDKIRIINVAKFKLYIQLEFSTFDIILTYDFRTVVKKPEQVCTNLVFGFPILLVSAVLCPRLRKGSLDSVKYFIRNVTKQALQ